MGQFRAFEYEYGNFFQNKLTAVQTEQLKGQEVFIAAFFCRQNVGSEDDAGCWGPAWLWLKDLLTHWQNTLTQQTRAPQGLLKTVPGWGYRPVRKLCLAIVYLSRDLVLLSQTAATVPYCIPCTNPDPNSSAFSIWPVLNSGLMEAR